MSHHSIPEWISWNQLLVEIDITPGPRHTVRDVFPYVHGIRMHDGAKPWPHYRDAENGEWWSLSQPSDAPIEELVWLINLEQLSYRSRRDAQKYLEELIPELVEAAASFGRAAWAECSIQQALEKMERVARAAELLGRNAEIIVAAPEGRSYSIRQWWSALEQVGLEHGDGDMFWLLGDDGEEYFYAQPYTVPGYFDERDFDTWVALPDVALRFTISRANTPKQTLETMCEIADRLAQMLGPRLLSTQGSPFEPAEARADLETTIKELENAPPVNQ